MRQASPALRAITYILTFLLLALAAVITPSSRAAADWAPAVRQPLAANVLALGNANVAEVTGAASFGVNPAGLAGMLASEAQATHLAPMVDTRIEAVNLAFPSSSGGWGVAAQQMASTDLVKTDETGNIIGSFRYTETALSLAGGAQWRHLRAGLAVRGVLQVVDDTQKHGVELMAGLQQQLSAHWRAGIVAACLWRPSTEIELINASDPQDLWSGMQTHAQTNTQIQWKAGFSYVADAIDLHASTDGRRSALAAAWRPTPGLELRGAGESVFGELAWSFGVGLAGPTAAIDYAYLPGGQGDLPQQLPLGHVISVRFMF